MQFLIDTATDSAVELYRIGRFLVEQFETVSVPAQEARPAAIEPEIRTQFTAGTLTGTVLSAAPPPPLTMAAVVGDDDPEVEFDAAGNVTAVTVSTELPAAPPPPPPIVINLPLPVGPITLTPIPDAMPAPPGPAVPAELDSRGMPWDARIHASNRSRTIKNEWKRKRGVDDTLVTACEAQNKPGNVQPVTIPAASGLPMTTAVPPVPTVAASAPPSPSPPPPPLTAGPVVPAAVVPSAIDFRGLMQKIQKATADGKLTADQVNAALAGIGLRPEEMAQLINNAPLIASVNAAVDACLV